MIEQSWNPPPAKPFKRPKPIRSASEEIKPPRELHSLPMNTSMKPIPFANTPERKKKPYCPKTFVKKTTDMGPKTPLRQLNRQAPSVTEPTHLPSKIEKDQIVKKRPITVRIPQVTQTHD